MRGVLAVCGETWPCEFGWVHRKRCPSLAVIDVECAYPNPGFLFALSSLSSHLSLLPPPPRVPVMPIPDSVCVPYPPDADYEKQMFELPGTKKPGQTGVYTSRRERLRP